MGGFYSGAYSQPLQRQASYGTGQDMSAPDEAWDMRGPTSPSSAPVGNGPTQQPSRFRAFLGSLGQMGQQQGQPQGQPQQRTGILQGIGNLTGYGQGATTGGGGAMNAAAKGGILGLGKFLL